MNASIELSQKKRTYLYVWMLVALMLLLVTATYTFFSISRTPNVNEMALYVNAGEGLELAADMAADDADWTQRLDFSSLVTVDTPLKPVTWSAKQNAFVTAKYGLDGRLMDSWQVLTDPTEATPAADRYYAVSTFFARTDQNCTVSLAQAVEVNDGESGAGTYVIGTPVWDAATVLHNNGGNGAECAIRFGFKITHLDVGGNMNARGQEFYVYEPNCDRHINGNTGYTATASIDGTATLVDDNHMILQTASTWSEAYPVQRTATVYQMGDFSTDTSLFQINADEFVRIDLYIWLDGQDVDCTNEIEAAKLFANIQFHTDYTGSSGLAEIY